MILSHEPKRSNSRWLRACVLLCAMVVLPLGMASAQDYGAVGKRLKKSVRKGEITQQHADAMMAALKKEAPKSKSDTKLESAWKKLQAMVKKGKLTEEQAHAKMSAIKTEAAEKGIKERMAAGRRQRGGEHRHITREEFARAEVELRKGVAEGRIPGANARARIQARREATRGTGGWSAARSRGGRGRVVARSTERAGTGAGVAGGARGARSWVAASNTAATVTPVMHWTWPSGQVRCWHGPQSTSIRTIRSRP